MSKIQKKTNDNDDITETEYEDTENYKEEIDDIESDDDVESDDEEESDDDAESDNDDEESDDDENDDNYNDILNDTNNNEIKYIEIKKDKRKTINRLTKYELVRVISERKQQLIMGAMPLIKNYYELENEEEIVIEELKHGMIPFKIKRPLPNNTYEVWDVSELTFDHLELNI